MADLAASISDLVAGDDYEITRTITGLPSGYALNKAWLTVKASAVDADPGIFQKAITTSNVDGTGQIGDSGSSDGIGAVRFDLVPADTLLLTPGTAYVYDIQIRYTNSTLTKVNTPEIGTITTTRGVTVTTA